MNERRFDPAKIARLDNPERRKAFPPDKILAMLAIGNDEDVLDLGAGSGYFTIPAAAMTQGTVYALDVERRMLDVLEENVQKQGVKNVQPLQGMIENIPLDNEKVHRVIASLVMHEIEPLSKGLQEIARVLKPGGKCLCLEWAKKPTDQGPPMHHRIDSEEMRKAVEECGLTVDSLAFPTDSHYIIVFGK